MQVQLKRLDPRAVIPAQGTTMSAGFDLVACIDAPITIKQGQPAVLIPTGLSIYIADKSVVGLIVPRSGLGHKQGLVMGNTIGVIDADYQGHWYVSAWNRGQQIDIVINPGDRLAQVVFVPVVHPEFCIVHDFSDPTERGAGGYGSTGVSAIDEDRIAEGLLANTGFTFPNRPVLPRHDAFFRRSLQ